MNNKILIIDDDIEILDMLDTILSNEGYEVLRAESGKEAISLLQSDPVDLVITDMSMPVMGGLEVLAAVKQLDENMEIIVLTGDATLENAVQALKEDGAFNYLTKPLENIEELLISVKRAIEKRKLRSENKTLIEELKNEVEERIKVERQLVQSKTNLQSVFDGISEPLIMVDRKMTIKVLNEPAKNYTQLSRYQDILDKPCFSVLAGRSTACKDCKLLLAMSSGSPTTFERNGLKDKARVEEVVIYPIQNKMENEGNAIIRISDITEQKKIEEQLIRTDRLSSLGQLSGGIAHEIRNPLSSINLFTDILCDEEKYDRTAQENELFDEIKDNINRIEKIIKQVLDFAKPPVTTSNEIDLNELTQESIKFWASKLRKSGIRLNLNIKDGLPPIQGDVIGLQQVINNVILNAIEAMEKGGDINISISQGVPSTGEHKSVVYLKVSDTGPGISKNHQEDIFNPFFTTKATGTGLGLSISHQIIKRQGGTFTVESNPDAGTTFIIELPAADSKRKTTHTPSFKRCSRAN
ncbi:ATP-binding protein [Desulfosarcina sp.]|uniref:hybrid sensor histidine kinase/response regulator n=1 Tax=Desulfosarcina sp. TaxID=2027861 RepID=UPI003565145E